MTRHKSPPRWLWAVWIVALIVLVALRTVIDLGDSGFTNLATFVVVALSVVVGGAWFVLHSGHSARLRWGSAAAVVVVLMALPLVVEQRGMSGTMLPILGLRGTGSSGPGLDRSALAGSRAIDLLSSTTYDFTGFLGSARNLRVDNVRLARDWQAAPPELLWKQPIGIGLGGYAVVNGYAATLEEREGVELVTLYDVATGELLWATEIGEAFEHMMGAGPRSTPLIHQGVVYAMGVRGHLVALNGATGELMWDRDILRDYRVSQLEENANVQYGRATSPLIVGDALIVGVGGSADNRVSVIAYQKAHGEVLWESGKYNISMASPGHGILAGIGQVLMVNEGFVTGHEVATGRQLWEFPWPGTTAGNASTSQAQPVAPDKVFVSKGYGTGAALYRLVARADGTFSAEQMWHSSRVLRTKLTNVAIKDGFVYGLSEGILECVDLATGERAWKAGRYNHGQILLVGDVLLVLSEEGELFMVEASPESTNNVLGQIQAIDGHTWNNFALYGDIVVVRNAQEAAAYRLPLDEPLAPPVVF